MNKKMIFFLIIAFMTGTAGAGQSGQATVAVVNGAAITESDVAAEVTRLLPQVSYHGKVTEERRAELREKAVDTLIVRELQYQDALARDMKPDKKKVRQRMKQIRDRFKTAKEYKQALAAAVMSERDLRAIVERNTLIEAAVEKVVADGARVHEHELKAYYDRDPSKFKEPETVRIRIISANDKKKAAAARARVKAGEDFGIVAEQMSEDKYRVKGGDLGYVHRGRIVQKLEDAAFLMKPGEVSGPVKADDIWYILKVEDRKPARQMTFEESRDRLKKEMEKNRARDIDEKWVAGLRAKAKIEMKPREKAK